MDNQDNFNKIASHPLQTWEWGEFRKVWGNKVIRTDFGQIVFSKIPHTEFTIGTFIKGPKPDSNQLQELKKIGREENAIFIKLEPAYVKTSARQAQQVINKLKEKGCVSGKTLFTPTTFWVDLTKTEEELLDSFSPKTRYNIRLAQKHGVKVMEDNSDKAFEKYTQLTRETVERQGFYAHTEKYHRLMWNYLHTQIVEDKKEPIARLLVARYNPPATLERSDSGRGNEIITTWIVFVWHDFLYYPYGASSSDPKYKPLMANNLIMWEAIRYGKKLGLKTFDLWGREPGKGFTKFKEGYNPQVVEFLGTWDLPISFLYWPYRIAESLRWLYLRLKTKLGIFKPKFS